MSEGFVPSRRQLVLGGAVLVAALPGSSAAFSRAFSKPLALKNFDDWKAQVGSSFELATETAVAPMALVAVRKGHRQPAGMKRSSNFTAVFEMDAAAAPQDGIYKVRHPEYGQAALYVAPGASHFGKTRLNATFS